MKILRTSCAVLVFAITFPAAADELVWGPIGAPRPGSDNKVWDAHCTRDNEKVVSGACIINPGSGVHSLQDFGPDQSLKAWTCGWTEHINSATARALCAK
jgi:hypothetical protein